MSRHRPFKRQLKKSPVGEFEIKKVIREASAGPGKRLGDIPFNDLMLNYATLSGDFEAVSANFAAVSGIVDDGFDALSAEIDKKATIADATLTNVYSNNPTFTAWVVEPALDIDRFEVSVKQQANSKWCLAIVEESSCGMGKGDASSLSLSWQNGAEAEYGIVATRETANSEWTIVVDDPNAVVFLKLSASQWTPYKKNLIPVGDAKGDATSTTLTWTDGECQIRPTPFVATRTRTDIAGYILGSQTEKPLQKKLTFDSTPTAGSGNPVTSDGICTAIEVAAVDMVSLEWSALKTLRDSGTLVPGRQYRITDYVATVANDTNARSANHPFDLIVVADSESKINEKARAIRHVGDTYFPASVKFEVWQVWYCLDNDTSRFEWADATNGKGVIYRLIDEWRNDCPYDFKGIQFKAYGDTDNVWRYTFDSGGESDNTDYSLDGGVVTGNFVYGNVIRTLSEADVGQRLNIIVFKGINCYSNTFGYGCYSNTFGSNCYSNTFGCGCYSNTFGDGCYSNTFGDGCNSNTFGEYCYSNTFGEYCYSNTFGEYYYSNAFGSSCESNTFGEYCNSNTFGYGCISNTFGDGCNCNAFGKSCGTNTFGEYCNSNTFGDYCYSNTFGGNCNCNTFGYGCNSNTFGEYCNSNTFGDGCESNTFGDGLSPKSYCRYITVQSGNYLIYLEITGSTSDSYYYQNVEIKSGVNNKTITDSNVGQNFLTTYKPVNSQEISI